MKSNIPFYGYKGPKNREEKTRVKSQVEALLSDNRKKLTLSTVEMVEFMLKNAGVSGLKKARAAINKELKNPVKKNEAAHCIIVVAGDTFSHREALKSLGFKAKKLDNTWVNYREVLEDKFNHWKNEIESQVNNALVFKTDNIEKVMPLVKEVIELEREENATEEKEEFIEDHEMQGQVVECTKWYGKIIQEELKTEVIFRNLKIKKVYKETEKAIQVDAELFGGVARACGVCGRVLDNEISRACGIGPVCAEKIGFPRPTMENAREIVKMLEEKSKEAGELKKKWVPKSQFKNVETK